LANNVVYFEVVIFALEIYKVSCYLSHTVPAAPFPHPFGVRVDAIVPALPPCAVAIY
jgi:hypothetical protein